MTTHPIPARVAIAAELTEALARAESWSLNSQLRPSPEIARNVVSVLAAEVKRLQEVLQRAKQESELIQYDEKSVVIVPYWFMQT